MQPFFNLLHLGAGGGPISISLSASSRSVETAGYGGATGTTGSVTATVSGGNGPYSYAWSCTNGWSANSPTSATTTFTSPSISHGQSSTSTATLTVTDTGSGVTAQATVSLSHTRTLGDLSWSILPAQQQVYGDGVPNAIVAGSWTITIGGGSGDYSYTPSWVGDTFWSGGVSGNALVGEMNVDYGTSKGGVWTLDVTDNVTSRTLHVERGMTFTNPSP